MAKRIKIAHKIGELKREEYLSLGVGTPVGDWNKTSELYHEQLLFQRNNKSEKPFNISVQEFLNQDKNLESRLIEWGKKIIRDKLNRQTFT